jgi:hypothetical protein
MDANLVGKSVELSRAIADYYSVVAADSAFVVAVECRLAVVVIAALNCLA